jgi:HEAT repeat protein
MDLTVPALLQRLTAEASSRRLKAWITLVESIGSAELFARVSTLHGHPDPLIRLSVARALKRHRDPETEEVLLIALHDHDWRVRAVAARSLGILGNAAAVPRLAVGLRDVRWWVRFRCGLALAQLGDQGRGALDDARRDVDRYAGEMATMIGGLSADSVVELAEG